MADDDIRDEFSPFPPHRIYGRTRRSRKQCVQVLASGKQCARTSYDKYCRWHKKPILIEEPK